MTISFNCSACGRDWRVDRGRAGKRARCPCGQKVVVPAAQPRGEASRAALTLPPPHGDEAPALWALPVFVRPVASAAAPPQSSRGRLWLCLSGGAAFAVLVAVGLIGWLLFHRPAPSAAAPVQTRPTAELPAPPKMFVGGGPAPATTPRPPTGPIVAPVMPPPAPPADAKPAGPVCTVRLWDIDGGVELCCFLEHTAPVYAVAVSPGGRRAVSGDANGDLQLWALPK